MNTDKKTRKQTAARLFSLVVLMGLLLFIGGLSKIHLGLGMAASGAICLLGAHRLAKIAGIV